MVAHAPAGTLKGARDRALLLFASAMRRSELVALDLADLELTAHGLLATVRRSKTDQEAKGQVRAIPFGRSVELCPVRALRDWLERAGLTEGALFRSVDRHGRVGAHLSGRSVADVFAGNDSLVHLSRVIAAEHLVSAIHERDGYEYIMTRLAVTARDMVLAVDREESRRLGRERPMWEAAFNLVEDVLRTIQRKPEVWGYSRDLVGRVSKIVAAQRAEVSEASSS